jgi:ABC-type polysaccharide/polyol phosphate export permease
LCPIVYPATQVPERYSWTLSANPFAAIVQLYHAILLRGDIPSAVLLEASLVWALFSLIVGATIFQRYRDHLAEAL